MHILRNKWVLIGVAVLLLAGWLMLRGDGGQAEGGPQGQQAGAGMPPPPPVTVAQPLKLEVADWDEFTGRFQAVDEVNVRARVGGYLQNVHFREGAIVKEGDLLFLVDPRPYEAAVKEAEAAVVAAKTRLDFTAAEYERATTLIKTGAIAKRLLDERTQQNKEAKAQLDATRAQLDKAKLDLEFTRVTAPVAGRVSRKLVTEGNLITGGTADSTLLTTIVSLDPIHFYFDVDEQSYLKYSRLVRKGELPSSRTDATPVQLALSDEREFTHQGYMDFVDNRLDGGTGTMRGRAVFANPDYLLTPGMFGRVRIQGSGRYEAVLIPDNAVMTDQSRKYVYVVDGQNMVSTRDIQLGPINMGLRVVRSGLKGDEWIVISGMQRVREGAPTTPERSSIKRPAEAGSGEAPAPGPAESADPVDADGEEPPVIPDDAEDAPAEEAPEAKAPGA